jgi:hypothetical protein
LKLAAVACSVVAAVSHAHTLCCALVLSALQRVRARMMQKNYASQQKTAPHQAACCNACGEHRGMPCSCSCRGLGRESFARTHHAHEVCPVLTLQGGCDCDWRNAAVAVSNRVREGVRAPI